MVRVKLRERACMRSFPEGSSYCNLKENSRSRLAADGGDCHMTDNRKLLDRQVIPGEPLKVPDRVAAPGPQR